MYHVTVTLSKDNGNVKDTSCDCKASALGRCNHVAGPLFTLLDWSEKGQQSCTKLCYTNLGMPVLVESQWNVKRTLFL